MRLRTVAPLLAAGLAAACGQEDATGVGGGLLPTDAVVTFEVILPASAYLVSDTAFGLYSEPADADFAILADRWDDALDSRQLLRYTLPASISAPDSAGTSRTDTVPTFVGGRILFAVDTLRSTAMPARVAVYRTAEEWDDLTATWTMRVDSMGARLTWSQPGGPLHTLVGTADWEPGQDSLAVPVDSATMAAWRADTTNTRGALIVMETEGSRLRVSVPLLEVQARPSFRPDTVVTVSVFAPDRTFIYQPAAGDSASAPRIGGTPNWRTYMRLRDRLDTLTVACPMTPTCRVRLRDAAVNRAALRLQPVPSPAGLAPESGMLISAHFLLPAPNVPLHRFPLTDALALTPREVPASSFLAPGAPVFELGVTDLILAATRTPEETPDFRPTWIALLSAGVRTLGFGSFAELPSLRIVISMSRELQLP